MRHIKKALLSILFSSNVLYAQDIVSLDVGTWYMSWRQTSQASSMLSNDKDALNINYSIDNAIAQTIKMNLNYRYINAKLEYIDSISSKNEQKTSSFNLGLSILELIPYLNIELRYVKAKFSGAMSATDNNGIDKNQEYGKGTFDADVDIADIIFYPFNDYVGLGYRNYSYAFPQDVYVTNDTTGKSILGSLAHIKYKGYFYTLALDNKRLVDKEDKYNGVVYTATYGIGQLTPHSITNSKSTKEDTKLIDSYLGKNDAQFIDVMFGYKYKQKKSEFFGYGITTGYRYNKIETKSGSKINNDGYSIRTKFNTEFYGPFIGLEISY